jgi:hypothetical protein
MRSSGARIGLRAGTTPGVFRERACREGNKPFVRAATLQCGEMVRGC